jgi:hypothetical protein
VEAGTIMGDLAAINLWTFFVSNLVGSFWMAVLVIAVMIFVLMAMVGRMSKISIMFYIMTFFMVMSVGYGLKWITVLISMGILTFVYLAIRNATEG